jgi:hypothetical protein
MNPFDFLLNGFIFCFIYLFRMKKKLVILNYSLVMVVLFGVLFQSLHSFEHLVEQLTAEHCDHKYHKGKTEFTHSHHDFDDCFVCEYSFSNYIPTDFFSFEFKIPVNDTISLFGYGEKIVFFSGSVIKSRGPPSVIV